MKIGGNKARVNGRLDPYMTPIPLYTVFRYADLAQACPNVSRPTIKRVLGQLRKEGKVECMRPGRDAIWEKKGS